MLHRCAFILFLAATGVLAAAGAAAGAATGACADLEDPAERARCEIMRSAQDRARDEAERAGREAVDGQSRRAEDAANDGRTELGRRWDDAVREARRPDFGAWLRSRDGMFVVGLVWLLFAMRYQWRRGRRRHRV